ncbi:MAG: chemotaxis protein CheD [Thermodesulfobacteriota bacterium]|nr:MAG: chemotaxis protein CheD [Thermodesulfobacteriota bacterium]
MKIGRAGDILVTHGLGSCLGLMLYDPVVKVGGMLHAMLPLSSVNPQKAESNPFMFVDTGVRLLFKEMYAFGGEKNRMKVKAVGCSQPADKNELFRIGERNYTILRKLLWKNSVLLEAEDIGGTISRTVFFEISSGRTVIVSAGNERLL